MLRFLSDLRFRIQQGRRRRKQHDIRKLFGKIDFDPSYDYKAERRRKMHRLAAYADDYYKGG
jgi:hypothetical protein